MADSINTSVTPALTVKHDEPGVRHGLFEGLSSYLSRPLALRRHRWAHCWDPERVLHREGVA
jgi:hypothetical protein